MAKSPYKMANSTAGWFWTEAQSKMLDLEYVMYKFAKHS